MSPSKLSAGAAQIVALGRLWLPDDSTDQLRGLIQFARAVLLLGTIVGSSSSTTYRAPIEA